MPQSIKILDEHLTLPALDDNTDVYVVDDAGREWVATFFTIANVQTLMNRWMETGEFRAKLFWSTSAVIVEEISDESVRAAVLELIRVKEFEKAFESSSPSIEDH